MKVDLKEDENSLKTWEPLYGKGRKLKLEREGKNLRNGVCEGKEPTDVSTKIDERQVLETSSVR